VRRAKGRRATLRSASSIAIVEKIISARRTVEERPFQGRVQHALEDWAFAPVD